MDHENGRQARAVTQDVLTRSPADLAGQPFTWPMLNRAVCSRRFAYFANIQSDVVFVRQIDLPRTPKRQ